MNKILTIAMIGIAMGGAALAATEPAPVQNKESAGMQEWLRPYLEPEYNPPEGMDKDRASIKENARKITEALPAKLSAPVGSKKRILVLSYKPAGQVHVPGMGGCLELLRAAAKKYPGAFEVVESYTHEGIDAKMLAGFDVVVLNNISQCWGLKAEDDLYNKLLPEFVKNGGGLFAVHGSALLLKDKPDSEYNKMLGGFTANSKLIQSNVHPKAVQGFNCCSRFPVKLIEAGNPLAAAFRMEPAKFTYLAAQVNGNKRSEFPVAFNAPLELVDELYVMSPESNQDKTARVIASVDPDKVPKESYPEANDFSYALIWIKPYGKGRVYYNQLGHNQGIFTVPCVALAMLDGLQYATGDLNVPDLSAKVAPTGQ